MANDGTSEIAAKHLRLHLADGVGPITFGRMIKYFGHIDRALGATAAELRCLERVGGRTAETIARSRDAAPVEQELALAAQHGIRVICRDDEDYPVGLRHIPDPPICLYVKGRLLKADPVALAVVGSRRATHYGHEQARSDRDQTGTDQDGVDYAPRAEVGPLGDRFEYRDGDSQCDRAGDHEKRQSST